MNQSGKLITVAFCCVSAFLPTRFALAQTRPQDEALVAHRNATEKELESVAIIDRKVMVAMRDGKRMQANITGQKMRRRNIPSSSSVPPTTSITGTSS